ncbi:phage tail tip lysozyme [Lactimicrobium massiliense]|uniref:phage tail tip lysozyme n=1 Tax=Lactimicrobium massiliense TaxID=2161814 RepID=UPI00107F53B6|nr:phage tail tip lysozyme [Lactimicrobium massiliense]
MSENVLTMNGGLQIESLTIPELAERIRIGDRDCMMRMYRLLHDDLFAMARNTIASAKQAEFVVRKTFAEVFYHHEDIDPDLFELNLVQVLSENTRREDIRNTYTRTLKRSEIMAAQAELDKPTVSEVTSPLINAVKAKAVPARLAMDYAEAADAAVPQEQERSQSLTHTLSMPVLLSGACAIAAAGVAANAYHQAQVRKRDLSYTQMMDALNISFDTDESGNETSVFEYEPAAQKAVSDLVAAHTGTLKTSASSLDLSKVGDTLVNYELSDSDIYGQTARVSVKRTYTVQDTRAPEISLANDSVKLTEGDSFDANSVVAAVADPADGALTQVEEEPAQLVNDAQGRLYENGWYTVSSNVDTNTAGTYEVTVHAVDNHGNASDASVAVTVKAKPKVVVTTASAASSAGSGSTVTAAASVNTGANASSIYSLLTGSYGFTKAAAAGILANMQIESSFNPNAGSSYYGLCQWGGSRVSNLSAFCAANGYSSSSVDGQVAFMVSEMGSGMISTMNSFSDDAQGAADAGTYFRVNFERSAGLNNVANIAAGFYNAL